MRAALLLAGISYKKDYHHFSGSKTTINFALHVKNIRHHLIGFFSEPVDVYLATNEDQKNRVLDTYRPVASFFDNDHNRIYKIIKGLELVLQNVDRYDVIIVTRFDIYFVDTHFDQLRHDALNVFSVLEKPDLIDDNFYLFPTSYLSAFHALLLDKYRSQPTNRLLLHYLWPDFNKKFQMNFLYSEYCDVSKLTSFRLRYFVDCEFWMNLYLFSDEVWYNARGGHSKMMITQDRTIHLHKVTEKPAPFCWVGYKIPKKGGYTLSFRLYPEGDLGLEPFLKLHCPVTFYHLPKAPPAFQWSQHSVQLDVKEDGDNLCFIFDHVPQKLRIKLHSVEIRDSLGWNVLESNSDDTLRQK